MDVGTAIYTGASRDGYPRPPGIPRPTLLHVPPFSPSTMHTVHSYMLQPSQHRLGEPLHRLPHPQVGQDLLGAPQDGVELVRPVEHLDDAPHARLRDAAPAEDVDGLVGDFVR